MAISLFPKFTSLTFDNKAEYEELIKDYPPIADISFAGLMGWWGLHKAPRVSLLNDNLVVEYVLEGDSNNSGLSLIGTSAVDESICLLFDYLREKGEIVRLVHVPEFVINNMQYPELFTFDSERSYDEYVIALSKFYPLERASHYQRQRAKSLMAKLQGQRVRVGPLDLTKAKNQKLLLDAVDSWPVKGINNLSKREDDALGNAIANARPLGLHNVCISINDEIHGFLLFQAPQDSKYITLEYVRISYAMPHLLNFSAYMFAEWLVHQQVEYANVCMDYGKPILRVAKLALGPVNFFRKYTLKPESS